MLFLFGKNTKEPTQRTLIRGPGARLKIVASKKPRIDKLTPTIEARTIPIHSDVDLCDPNKVGEESKAITRLTPTADIELTMTRAVVNPRAKFKDETFIPLAAALSGSSPICTSLS